jgi:hypothetical protein
VKTNPSIAPASSGCGGGCVKLSGGMSGFGTSVTGWQMPTEGSGMHVSVDSHAEQNDPVRSPEATQLGIAPGQSPSLVHGIVPSLSELQDFLQMP